MDSETWNERYRASVVWSGAPNDALVRFVPGPSGGSAPGSGHGLTTALDLGCGEGADALWLASRGWSVVGVDWAGVALDRARRAAAQAGADVRFVEGDITDRAFLAGLSDTGTFGLVTVGYLHPEPADRTRLFAHLPTLVAPGGRLFVLAHDPEHGARGLPGPPVHRLLTPADIEGLLELPGDFDVEVRDLHTRHDKGEVTAVDSVVLARRRDS